MTQKDQEAKYLCDRCNAPTDKLYHMAPYCEKCETLVRDFRGERDRARKATNAK